MTEARSMKDILEEMNASPDQTAEQSRAIENAYRRGFHQGADAACNVFENTNRNEKDSRAALVNLVNIVGDARNQEAEAFSSQDFQQQAEESVK